ncbi:MAG: hypothetical protein LH632_14040 [Rhodoferax sp.]|nr:hypothetical protein [Rhodoferax sp.]
MAIVAAAAMVYQQPEEPAGDAALLEARAGVLRASVGGSAGATGTVAA